MRKQVRDLYVNCEASFLCQQNLQFAFVENRGKILNVSACLLLERVGEKKAKSHVVLKPWIPSEPETPLATSWPRRCLSSGKRWVTPEHPAPYNQCGLMLPKLLCKYTYSLSKIGRIGDLNCPSWDSLCVQHLCMKEIVLVISQIPRGGMRVASGKSDQVFRSLFAL